MSGCLHNQHGHQTSQPGWDIQESRGRASRERRNQRRANNPSISERSHWWQDGWIPESVWRQCWKEGVDGWQWIGFPSQPETTVGSQRWRANKDLEVRLSFDLQELQKSRQDLQQDRIDLAKQKEELLLAMNASSAAASSSYAMHFQAFHPFLNNESPFPVSEVLKPEDQLPEKPKHNEVVVAPEKKVSHWHGPLATSCLPAGPLRIPIDTESSTKKKQISEQRAAQVHKVRPPGHCGTPSQKPSAKTFWHEMTPDTSESDSAGAPASSKK